MQTIRRWRLSSSEFRTEGLSYYVVCAWPRNAYFVNGRPESHSKPASVSCDAGPVELRSMPWLFLVQPVRVVSLLAVPSWTLVRSPWSLACLKARIVSSPRQVSKENTLGALGLLRHARSEEHTS